MKHPGGEPIGSKRIDLGEERVGKGFVIWFTGRGRNCARDPLSSLAWPLTSDLSSHSTPDFFGTSTPRPLASRVDGKSLSLVHATKEAQGEE